MISTHLGDNEKILKIIDAHSIDLAYCDPIYEKTQFFYLHLVYELLKENSILIVQTDWHTQHKYRNYLELVLGLTFVNHLVWKNEWGNHPKNRFHQCYDDVLVYCKGNNYKFYPERIQVPKKTLSKGLNPSGRTTKTATAWIDDITLTTVSSERVKKNDGHLLRWQKPLKLYDRIIAPFSDKFDNILDPFMGSGSLGKWCALNERNYIGIESDEEVYKLAQKNLGL